MEPPQPRLNCTSGSGAFGRVSPSLVAAERNERSTAKRPKTSFKESLDGALDELDAQAEDGQISSGAYVSLAKRIKTVYDSHSGREDGMRYAVIKMVLEDGRSLANAPEEVDWVEVDFLDDLLAEASKKDSEKDFAVDWHGWEDWMDDILEVYFFDVSDFNVVWPIFEMMSGAIQRAPICMGRLLSYRLGKKLVSIADEVDLETVELTPYSKDIEEELMDFWIGKFRAFPSDYLYEFMTTLFDNETVGIQYQVREEDEYVFRNKLTKKIRKSLKHICDCSTCSQLYRKHPAKPSEKA